MNACIFLLWTAFKNRVKEMLKKPLLCICLGIFALSAVITMMTPATEGTEGHVISNAMTYFTAGTFLVYSFLVVMSIMTGLKSGSTFFQMGDVNMLFKAPISPRTILFYGLVKQLGTSFLLAVILFFQIPTLHTYLGFDTRDLVSFFLSCFMLMIAMSVLSLTIYSLTANHPTIRLLSTWFLYAVLVIWAGGLIVNLLAKGASIGTFVNYLNDPLMQITPISGWLVGMMTNIMNGEYRIALVFFLLTVFFPTLGIVLVSRMESDFFEDVLASTEKSFRLTLAANGEVTLSEDEDNSHVGRSGLVGKGTGESVFFFRHLTEQRRSLGLVLDKGSLVTCVAALILAVILKDQVEKSMYVFIAQIIGFAGLSFVLYIQTAVGRFAAELKKPYIYTVPGSAMSKLFYANLASVFKSLLEGLISFSIISFIANLSVPYVLCATFLYATLSQIYGSMNVLSLRMLGPSTAKYLQTWLYSVSAILLLGPGIAIGFGLGVLFYAVNPMSVLLAYVIVGVYNLLLSLFVLWMCRGLLEHAEHF
ncbi:MAG TPA: putative ABC exporter domain-containing protein [Bacillota bacterium]|nr:putative ABC exporter domain-containing protein [Bacillota bacterium]HPE38030.1 putative ABC exporter domain-containing protein [Bacillota bacterium]